jgi:ankyrin repeat protein
MDYSCFTEGADPNIPNERDFTPLHHACAYGYIQLTKLLLQKKANIQAVTKELSTPLHQVRIFCHAPSILFFDVFNWMT